MMDDSRAMDPAEWLSGAACAPPVIERAVATGAGRVYLAETGTGTPVIFLHGLGSFSGEILSPFTIQPPAGRYIALDRPGYGFSDPLPAASSGPDAQAGWLESLLNALEIPAAVIVAHSIGAATALHFASSRPDRVAGLLLLAPYCRPTRPAFAPLLRAAMLPLIGRPVRRLIRFAAERLGEARLAALFRPNPVPARMKGFPLRHVTRSRALLAMGNELRGFNRAMMTLSLRLRRIRTRTVILTGDSDAIAADTRHALWLARRLPRAELVMLPRTGHMPHHVAPGAADRALRRILGR
jgi:pimeloyl-ACP methyl ester carboxylesterase